MKTNIGETQVIIGKRVTIGAAVGSIATVLAELFPEFATAIIGGATAVTFVVQLLVAHKLGITTKENNDKQT